MAVRLSRRDALCRSTTTHLGPHHHTSPKGHLQCSIIPIAARGVFPNPPYALVSKLRLSFDGIEASKSWNCGALTHVLLSPNSNPSLSRTSFPPTISRRIQSEGRVFTTILRGLAQILEHDSAVWWRERGAPRNHCAPPRRKGLTSSRSLSSPAQLILI
jgi:hypothetical protein